MLPCEGHFLVVKVMSDVTFRIQKSSHSKPQVVHADRLKPYEGPKLRSMRPKYQLNVLRARRPGKSYGLERRRL